MALQRVTSGLSASAQVLAVRVEDGTIRLNLGQVLYVRTTRDEHKGGVGAA